MTLPQLLTFINFKFAEFIINILPVGLWHSHRQQLRSTKWHITTTTTLAIPILSELQHSILICTRVIQVLVTVRGRRVTSTDDWCIATTECIKVTETIPQLLQLIGIINIIHDLVQLVLARSIVCFLVVA